MPVAGYLQRIASMKAARWPERAHQIADADMTNEPSLNERRQHMRASAPGTVILRGRGREARGRSVAVSETTLEVRCEGGCPLVSLAGIPLEIEMRLDGAAGTWFLLHGRVTRVRPADDTLVVAIGALPLPLAVLLTSKRGQPRTRSIEVMVVDRDLARRAQVADAFRAEGCHVLEVSTPLEAIDRLGAAAYATDVIAVADTVPDSIAIDLRNHLDAAYVDALVVAVGEPEWVPGRARLDPSESEGLLPAHVQSLLLLRPNRQERLAAHDTDVATSAAAPQRHRGTT